MAFDLAIMVTPLVRDAGFTAPENARAAMEIVLIIILIRDAL